MIQVCGVMREYYNKRRMEIRVKECKSACERQRRREKRERERERD